MRSSKYVNFFAALSTIRNAQKSENAIYSFAGIGTEEIIDEYDAKNSAIFIKKVNPKDMILSVPFCNWQYKNKYTKFDQSTVSSDSWCCTKNENNSDEYVYRIFICTKAGNEESTIEPGKTSNQPDDGYRWEQIHEVIVDKTWEWLNEEFIPLYKEYDEDVYNEMEGLESNLKLLANYITFKITFIGSEEDDKTGDIKFPANGIKYHRIGLINNVKYNGEFATGDAYKLTYKVELNNCIGDFQKNEIVETIGSVLEGSIGKAKLLSDISQKNKETITGSIKKTLLLYEVNENFKLKVNNTIITNDDTIKNSEEKYITLNGLTSYASGEMFNLHTPEIDITDANVLFYTRFNDKRGVIRHKNQSETYFVSIEI